MELKAARDIVWNDLPGVEAPFFAMNLVKATFLNTTFGQFQKVSGIDDILREELRFYSTERSKNNLNIMLEMLEIGELFLVHARGERPMSPVVRWEKDDNHPNKGKWKLTCEGEFVAPRVRWIVSTATTFHQYCRRTEESHNWILVDDYTKEIDDEFFSTRDISGLISTDYAEVKKSNLSEQNPVEQRKQNYQQRKQIAAKASNTPEQQAAAARLLDNNDNILRAEAAEYVYKVDEFNRGHIKTLPKVPVGLNVLDPKNIPGLEKATFTSKKSGFGAALLKSKINGETMLTYRGTNNGVTGKKDWITNGGQSIGMKTEQYDQAMDLAEQVKISLDSDFVNVGHSLGGGQASAATAIAKVKAYTFNAAGLHPNTTARKGGMSNKAASKLIQTRAVKGEFLTLAQRHGNTALTTTGVGIGALAGPLGATLGYMGGELLPDIPEALGEMKTLPSVNGGSPVARHGMDQVIAGIEAQKKEDIKTLTG